jgi:hypothetical protein
MRFWRHRRSWSSGRKYGIEQAQLGYQYLTSRAGDRAAKLQQAIACYTGALRFFTAETTPHDYAIIQYDRGFAYADLPTGDHGANLQQAIACYIEVLRFRTPEADPVGYAQTQHDLATACPRLPARDRAAALGRIIMAGATGEVAPRVTLTHDATSHSPGEGAVDIAIGVAT